MSVREMRAIRLSAGDQIGNERVIPQLHLVLDSPRLIFRAFVMKIIEFQLEITLVVRFERMQPLSVGDTTLGIQQHHRIDSLI